MFKQSDHVSSLRYSSLVPVRVTVVAAAQLNTASYWSLFEILLSDWLKRVVEATLSTVKLTLQSQEAGSSLPSKLLLRARQ